MLTTSLIGIKGSGVYLPREQMDVKKLADKNGIDYTKLKKDFGVNKIHVAGAYETELEMSINAVSDCLKNAVVSPQEIDLVIYCRGLAKEGVMRSVSTQLIEKLRFENAYGFDLECGLIGGLIGLQVANDMIKNNTSLKNALVVAAQCYDGLYLFGGGSSRLKYMVSGDGAVAIMLTKDFASNTILDSTFLVDHDSGMIEEMLAENKTNQLPLTRLISKLSVKKIINKINRRDMLTHLSVKWVDNLINVLDSSVKSVNMDIADINYFIKTRLSMKETELLVKKLKISHEKILNYSSECGHLGQADILYNLHATLKSNELKNLDVVALLTANYDCSAGAIIVRR